MKMGKQNKPKIATSGPRNIEVLTTGNTSVRKPSKFNRLNILPQADCNESVLEKKRAYAIRMSKKLKNY